MRVREKATLAGILLIAVAFAAAEAAESGPAWVDADTLRVRSGAGTDRPVIGTLKRGDKVHVTGVSRGWCWAKLPDGRWGWLAEDYLEFSEAKGTKLAAQNGRNRTSAQPQPAWVNVSNAFVRAGAGADRDSVGKLPKGTKVHIVDRNSDWCKVSGPDIERGWIHADLLETNVAAGRRLAGNEAPRPREKAFVKGEAVHLRAGAGSRFDKVGKLRRGQTLWVVGQEGMWRNVQVNDGPSGWVAAWLIKTASGDTKAATTVAKASSSAASSPTSETLDEIKAWIGTETSNIRFGPGMDYDVKASLAPGTPVHVTDVDGHWCKVRMPSGKYGWAAGWVMNFQGPADQATAQVGGERLNVRVGWVARPEVNIRSGPGINYHEVAEAVFGTELVITDQDADGEWYKVTLSNGKQGWMATRYIDTREQRIVRKERGVTPPIRVASLPRRSSRRSYNGSAYEPLPAPDGSIAATAQQYLGDRYVRGGSSPGRFDCSGLVQHVYEEHGLKLNRTAADQYQQGVPVPRSELAPGDVVFFENTYKSGISHTGIYVGGSRFIHASNPGGGVKITSLDDPYYRSRYVGARRMR